MLDAHQAHRLVRPSPARQRGGSATTDFISSELHAYGRPPSSRRSACGRPGTLTHAIHAALAVGRDADLLHGLRAARHAHPAAGRRLDVRRPHRPLLHRALPDAAAADPERDIRAAAPGFRRARDPDRQPRRAAQRPPVGAPATRGAAARRRRRLLASLAGPVDIFFWTVMAALVVALARLGARRIRCPDVVQFVLAAVLLTYLMLFVDAAISDVVAGRLDQRLRRRGAARGRAATAGARPAEHRDLARVPRRQGGTDARDARMDEGARRRDRPARHLLRERRHDRPRRRASRDRGRLRAGLPQRPAPRAAVRGTGLAPARLAHRHRCHPGRDGRVPVDHDLLPRRPRTHAGVPPHDRHAAADRSDAVERATDLVESVVRRIDAVYTPAEETD